MATITIADLALDLNTDPRTARKFMRSITDADAQPGKGSRWAIEKRDVRSLRSKFAKFVAANEAAKLDREAARAAANDADDVATDEAPTDFDALEGPTDAELAELDD